MNNLAEARQKLEAAKKATDAPQEDILPIIENHNNGELRFDMSKAYNDVVNAVKTENRHGKMVVTFDIVPAVKGDATTVLMTVTVEANPPKPKPRPALYYITPTGGLSRESPNQRMFREVAPEAGFPAAER